MRGGDIRCMVMRLWVASIHSTVCVVRDWGDALAVVCVMCGVCVGGDAVFAGGVCSQTAEV